MKVADLHFENPTYKSNARFCEDAGCSLRTREGKPFCPEHVGENPYALSVLKDIARRKEEDAEVTAGKAPVSSYNVDGITVQGILQQLAVYGPRTRARLCRELSIDRVLLDGYAEALIKKRIVGVGITNRGSETLVLRKKTSHRSSS